MKPSSDVFNIESDECTHDLHGYLISVDDILQQVVDYERLKKRLIHLFDRFRQKNVKVKSSKFCIGPKVKFWVFVAGADEMR